MDTALLEAVYLWSDEPESILNGLERLGITDSESLRAWLNQHGGLREAGVHALHMESGMATSVCREVIFRLFY